MGRGSGRYFPEFTPKDRILFEKCMKKARTGLHSKYQVTRTDKRSAPGQKHYGCEYFVLDLTHDPHAIAALKAYATACESDRPALSRDLITKIGEVEE